MALRPTMAHLSTSSPRYADWMKVFGTDAVTVQSPIPLMIELPDGRREEAYLLDLRSLDSTVRAKLVHHIADRFGIPDNQVAAEIDRQGVPILAKDVAISADLRYFT